MAPIADRRRAPRLRSLLTGTIAFDDNNSTMDCTVRNISAWGAKIVLPDAFRVPDDFNLVVPHHDQTHRAKVIWRKGESAGLALSDLEEHEDAQPADAARSGARPPQGDARRALLSIQAPLVRPTESLPSPARERRFFLPALRALTFVNFLLDRCRPPGR